MQEQILRMFERFMNMPEQTRNQAIVEARNILENFRIVRANAAQSRSRSSQQDDQSGSSNNDNNGAAEENLDTLLHNALEDAILFQELVSLNPQLLAKLLESHNKKLRLLLADLMERRRTEQFNQHEQIPSSQLMAAAAELEKLMQQMRLQAAAEMQEIRTQKKQTKTSLNERGIKGLDAILEQMVRPAMASHEKTIAISRIFQAPPEALALAEEVNRKSEEALEKGLEMLQEHGNTPERH